MLMHAFSSLALVEVPPPDVFHADGLVQPRGGLFDLCEPIGCV